MQDEKELAEHNMLVDLGRNDIGKISRIGTVKVEKYMSDRAILPRHAHRIHRDRNDSRGQGCCGCCGRHPSGRDPFRSTEDPGVPDHRRAGRQTSEAFTAEPSDIWISQEIWTPASPSAWLIRKTGRVCVQSGAGIVADSVPEKEYRRMLPTRPRL